MALESSKKGPESRMTLEVTRMLPEIVEQIRSAAEQNNFLPAEMKELITVATNVDTSEVVRELLDHSNAPETMDQQIRRILNDRILIELQDVAPKTNGKEQEALSLFLRYNVLDLRPQR